MICHHWWLWVLILDCAIICHHCWLWVMILDCAIICHHWWLWMMILDCAIICHHWWLWMLILDCAVTSYYHCLGINISNISHFECCSDLWTTDHLITMSNNSLMKVSLVSHGNSVCECQGPAFLLCCTLFNMFRSPEWLIWPIA